MWAQLQVHVAVAAVFCRDVTHQWGGKGDQLGHIPNTAISVPAAPAHPVNLEKCFHLGSGLLLFQQINRTSVGGQGCLKPVLGFTSSGAVSGTAQRNAALGEVLLLL